VRYSLSHVHRLRQHHSHVRCICVTTALPSFSLPLRVAECPSSLSVPPFPPSRFSPSLLGVPSPSLHGIPHGVPRVLESLQRRPPGVYAVPPFRRSLRQTGSIILSGPPPFQRRPHRPRLHHPLGPTALPRATPRRRGFVHQRRRICFILGFALPLTIASIGLSSFFFQWSGGFSCTPRAVGPPDTGSRFCSAVT